MDGVACSSTHTNNFCVESEYVFLVYLLFFFSFALKIDSDSPPRFGAGGVLNDKTRLIRPSTMLTFSEARKEERVFEHRF